MIDQVEAVFRKLLAEELQQFGSKVITSEKQIVFGLPTGEKPKSAELCVYLQALQENVHLRDESFKVFKKPGGQVGTKQAAAVRVDLEYLVAVNAADHVEGAQALSEALGALVRVQSKMYNLALPELAAQGVQIVQLQVAQPDHSIHKDPSSFWLSHQIGQRPAIGLIITVSFNPFEARQVRLVREAMVGLIPATDTHGQAMQRGLNATRLSVAGVVMDAREQPISGAMVQVDGGLGQTLSDPNGLFFFLNLVPGATSISISAPGYQEVSAKVDVPDMGESGALEPLVITMKSLTGEGAVLAQLPEGASIEEGRTRLRRRTRVVSAVGRLLLDEGSPAAYVLVRCGDESTVTDSDGYFRIDLADDDRSPVVAIVPGVGSIEIPQGEPEFVLSAPDKASKRSS